MKRNLDIEKRIKERKQEYNPYGGMGMDGNSVEEKNMKYAELDYMKAHPEIYQRPPTRPPTNRSMYLINLN